MLMPLACAAPTSDDLARRLDIPICAVPSMIAAIPVVDPSAEMSKVVPGCCALNCSASCGTSFAPKVSEPLITSRSAFAVEAVTAKSKPSKRYFIFIGWWLFVGGLSILEFHVEVGLKQLVLIQ